MKAGQLRNWVALQHKSQLVKRTYLPYMHHLDFVAETVKDLVILGYETGLCHDLLEKTKVTAEELHSTLLSFGYISAEADLIVERVLELTDVFTREAYPEIGKRERKNLEAERLANISPASQTIKYADLIYNIRWVMAHEQPSKITKYLKRKQLLLLQMNKGDPALNAFALKLTKW